MIDPRLHEAIESGDDAALAALLRDEPDLRDQYIDLLMLDGHLTFEIGAAPVSVTRPAPKTRAAAHFRGRGPVAPRRIAPIAWSLAAALLVATAVLVVYLFVVAPSTPEPGNPSAGPPIATLIETRGGKLTTPHDFPSEGSQYRAGEYRLDSGTAEFMLTNSVNVKLRGETRMFMRNEMNVSLALGSAEFVVPKDANGFTVHLPGGQRVVDLGTRFRINLLRDRDAVIEVVEGEVRIDRRDNTDPTIGLKLATGDTAVISNGVTSLLPQTSVAMSLADDAPAIDGSDIAQFVGGHLVNDDTSAIWITRPRQGQSFKTGTSAEGYRLHAITLRHVFVERTWKETGPWEVRLGIFRNDDEMLAVGAWDVEGVDLGRTHAWVTFRFAEPIRLSPGTQYTFDVASKGNGIVLESALPGVDPYPHGRAFHADPEVPAPPRFMDHLDRVFHIDLTPVEPSLPIPEAETRQARSAETRVRVSP